MSAITSKTKAQKPELSDMPCRQSLFWDVDPKTLDPQRHARYIIERILDFGTDKEVYWMWHYYSRPLIRKVVRESRVLMPESKSLWTLLTTNR